MLGNVCFLLFPRGGRLHDFAFYSIAPGADPGGADPTFDDDGRRTDADMSEAEFEAYCRAEE